MYKIVRSLHNKSDSSVGPGKLVWCRSGFLCLSLRTSSELQCAVYVTVRGAEAVTSQIASFEAANVRRLIRTEWETGLGHDNIKTDLKEIRYEGVMWVCLCDIM
jgi:hypothetical protein